MAGKRPWPAGPWEWMGNGEHGSAYLATTHSGRIYVMGFERCGMQGAQPVFPVEGRLIPASEMLLFDVGEPDVKGIKAAKAAPSVYRYDVRDIDHPVARLLKAAPTMYEALARCASRMRGHPMWDSPDVGPAETLRLVEAALAAANPENGE